VHGLYLTE